MYMYAITLNLQMKIKKKKNNQIFSSFYLHFFWINDSSKIVYKRKRLLFLLLLLLSRMSCAAHTYVHTYICAKHSVSIYACKSGISEYFTIIMLRYDFFYSPHRRFYYLYILILGKDGILYIYIYIFIIEGRIYTYVHTYIHTNNERQKMV